MLKKREFATIAISRVSGICRLCFFPHIHSVVTGFSVVHLLFCMI
jgi:hypothetical protein